MNEWRKEERRRKVRKRGVEGGREGRMNEYGYL